MFKKLMLIAVVVVATAGLSGSALAGTHDVAGEVLKVNICHKTSSESNPWNAIQIADVELDKHLEEHGDFLYEGPVKDNGKPVEDGDQWCEDNVPTDPVDPVDPKEPEETTPKTLGTTTTTAPQVTAPVGAVDAGAGSIVTALSGLSGSLVALGLGALRLRKSE